MKRLQYETDFTDRISMIVGMLDGLIEGSYISPEDQRELRDIRSSIDTLIESYEVDIGAIKEATIEAKQSSNLAWGEVRKRGIEPTTGVQLLVLTKKDQSPEYSASDAIEEVLDETKLSEFDRLADCLNGDLRKFDQIYSGSYTLSDVISGLMSLEDSSNLRRTDRYPAKDIAAEVHDPSIKSQIGNVLGKVSDTSDRTPWTDRPLIYKYKSRPSAQYQITPYGRLAFEFYDNKSTRPRVRLHKLAWYEYWKTAETVSDIHPDNLLGGNYEQELNLAIEASEQILS